MSDILPSIHPVTAETMVGAPTPVSMGTRGDGPPGAAGAPTPSNGFPRITIRNTRGVPIDTDSRHQRAIAEARYKLSKGEQPDNPLEWRLPHAPPPARPDLSRKAPPLALQRILKRARKNIAKSLPNLEEALNGDFNEQIPDLSWSLAQVESLPPIVAAHLMHAHATRPPERQYMSLIGNVPTQPREVEGTDIREAEYTFPGWCYGCRGGLVTTYLCYGCERDPNPHYHQDKPARTGGGFTYVKRDKPVNEIEKNNPLYWKIMSDPAQYVFYDKGWDEMEKYGITPHISQFGKRRTRTYGDTLEEEDEDAEEEELDEREPEYSIDLGIYRHTGMRSPTSDMDSGKGATVDGSMDYMTNRSDFTSDMDDTSSLGIGMAVSGKPMDSTAKLPALEEQREASNLSRMSTGLTTTSSGGDQQRPNTDASGASKRPKLYKEFFPPFQPPETLDEDESKEGVKAILHQRQHRRGRNRGDDDAPKAFEIKREKSKTTVASDPFSKDREYSLNLGDGFKIKKSDKALTEFDEFKKGESSWVEPDKFELQQGDHKPTEHWEPTLQDKPKKRRSMDSPPPPARFPTMEKESTTESGRSPTPDSGVSSFPKQERVTLPPLKSGTGAPSLATIPSSLEARAISPSEDLHVTAYSESRKSSLQASDHASMIQEEDDNEAMGDNQSIKSSKSDNKSIKSSKSVRDFNEEEEDEAMEIEKADKTKKSSKKKTEEKRKKKKRKKTQQEEEEEKREESFIPMEPVEDEEEPEEKKKKEVVKKERREPTERKRPQRRAESEGEEDSSYDKDSAIEEPTPEPEEEEEEEVDPTPYLPDLPDFDLPAPQPLRRVEPPPLPKARPPAPPKLQEYKNPERPKREIAMTLVEVPPPMPEPPKQRRPPPSRNPKKKLRDRRKPPLSTKSSVAPVTKEGLKNITDPLDYLAKYCIIHPDRLPHYERVFYQTIGEQVYRYADVPHPDGAFSTDEDKKEVTKTAELDENGRPKQKTRLTEHERKMIDDMVVISRATDPNFARGENAGDQLVQKISYTLDTLIDKYEHLQDRMEEQQIVRNRAVVEQARKYFPEVCRQDYKPKKKKKKGKKKKAKEEAAAAGGAESANEQTEGEESEPKKPKILTDMDIIARLDKKMIAVIEADDDLRRLNLEVDRLAEKLKAVDDRIEDLEDEKKLMLLYARDKYFEEKLRDKKPESFMRPQSALYKKQHPYPNPEMNLTELEEALQQLNGHLISEKELEYIFHILNIPGRRRIDVQLFSVIAALSEKVRQVDPLIRKLINKFDFEALDVKMDKCKELFSLLDDDDFTAPDGKITSNSLVVELVAGGVTEEHTQYVISKFNREKRGIVDFLDFLTYVPLFIELHQRIVGDPLNLSRDL